MVAAATLTMCAAAPAPQTNVNVFDTQGVTQDQLSDEAQIVRDSMVVLEELTATPDVAIPQYLINRAEAIVVIPSLIKGGFIVGAEHGKGIMSRRNPDTREWSAPAFVNMTGGSIGWQIGAQAVDVVLLVMNQQGVTDLLEDRFTLGGSLSVTAGPVGRAAEASTDAQLSSQILAYSRARGLFAGATFEGAALHVAENDIQEFYGNDYSLEQILNGQVSGQLPPLVQEWKRGMTQLASMAPASAPATAGARAGDAADSAADRARDAADDAADRTRETVEDAAESTREAAEQAADEVEDAADKAADEAEDASDGR
jgi:lipid-binding SYLF domain-containing protein